MCERSQCSRCVNQYNAGPNIWSLSVPHSCRHRVNVQKTHTHMRLCATMRTTFPAESQNIHQMCVPICRLPKTCFGISSKDRNGLFGQPDLEGLKKLWSDCTCVRRIVPIFWGAGSSTGAKMDPIVLDRSLTDDPV